MVLDFSQPITQIDGKTPDAQYPTLKEVAIGALITFLPGDENVDPKLKFTRGVLAMKLHSATEPVEIDTTEVADLKKLIGRVFGPLVVAQAFNIIEGKRTE